jgi:CIC family chloride channel protein
MSIDLRTLFPPPGAAPQPPTRGLGDVLPRAPQALRALVRTNEIWLTVLAGLIGVAGGLLVLAISIATQLMHAALFELPAGQRLSGIDHVNPIRAVLVPALGGLLVGGFGLLITRWRSRRIIDPIEANALYGGQMSLAESAALALHTILSSGVGASVGLEAGYTQIGGAVASRAGRAFMLRRSDLRLMVGCGAAAAIAAAFDSPLTGAFYAFELVIGTYTLATLAPVVVAAIASVLTVQLIPFGANLHGGYEMHAVMSIRPIDYIAVLGLSLVSAGAGVLIMYAATMAEALFRRTSIPHWLRPCVGGLCVGLLALITPEVLGAGHGALQKELDATNPLWWLTIVLILKSIASAISIGSGFRGGLFFASLFLGSVLGNLFAGGLVELQATPQLPGLVGPVVGMSALAVAIIGGPLTMTFLALETTESIVVAAAVLAASVVTSLVVRRTFGYSFATWRFHLRGEAIRSAVDIGWVRNLTVARMMRREVRTVRADTTLEAFRRDFPLGVATRVVALDEAGRYAGLVLLAEAHAEPPQAKTVGEITRLRDAWLLPQMTITEAVDTFGKTEADALVVVDTPETRRVLGDLTEPYTLRRYSEELERRRQELSGEDERMAHRTRTATDVAAPVASSTVRR